MARAKTKGWDDIWWSWVKRGVPFEEAAFRAETWSMQHDRKVLAGDVVAGLAAVPDRVEKASWYRKRKVRHGADC